MIRFISHIFFAFSRWINVIRRDDVGCRCGRWSRESRVYIRTNTHFCASSVLRFTESWKAQVSCVENEGGARRVVRVGVGAAKRGPAWGLQGGRCVGVLRRSFCRGAWQSIGEALTSSGRERSIPTERFIRTRAGESGRGFFFISQVGPFFSTHAAPVSRRWCAGASRYISRRVVINKRRVRANT